MHLWVRFLTAAPQRQRRPPSDTASEKSLRQLAKRQGINPKTVAIVTGTMPHDVAAVEPLLITVAKALAVVVAAPAGAWSACGPPEPTEDERLVGRTDATSGLPPAGICAKLANTLAGPVVGNTQVAPEPVHDPPQPTNLLSGAGVAVSATNVPVAKLALHDAPQSIPAGELVTAPLPPTPIDSV